MDLVRGTRLLMGEEAKRRRAVIDVCTKRAIRAGFEEIFLPSLEFADLYVEKAGEEVLGQMYTFYDKKLRELCLRPEGTATIQDLVGKELRKKDTKLWYETRCWRYEKPQAGRYREFTQFGFEILNPKEMTMDDLITLADSIVSEFTDEYEIYVGVKRGLGIYNAKGFEVEVDSLGAQKQVIGGGPYEGGIGFAVGVDRLMLV